MFVLTKGLRHVGQMAYAMELAVAAFMLTEPCVPGLNAVVTMFMATLLA